MSEQFLTIFSGGEQISLLPQRAIYWIRKKTLLIADVHLTKSGHFRKNGIPVPAEVHLNDLQRISKLIERYETHRIVFLGDLFHSQVNSEWNHFRQWRKEHSRVLIQLVRGNHDLPAETLLHDQGIDEIYRQLKEDSFLFTHEKITGVSKNLVNVYGHIHPGIYLAGKAKQAVSLPCFVFAPNSIILPAFGNFTGHIHYAPEKSETIYAILNNRIELTMGVNSVGH